jgi:hypothetical protein
MGITQFRRQKILAICKNITMSALDPNFNTPINNQTSAGGIDLNTTTDTTLGTLNNTNQTQNDLNMT